MTPLMQWARRWQVNPQCLAELMVTMGAGPDPTRADEVTAPLTSETAVQQRVQLMAAQRGARLWRNNNGACEDKTGRQIRYGLGNISANVNRVFKSSDLIGPTPLIINPMHVGQTVAVFTAAECKAPGWTYQGDKPCSCKPGSAQCKPCHERAQLAFLTMINGMGGIGKFVSNPEDF